MQVEADKKPRVPYILIPVDNGMEDHQVPCKSSLKSGVQNNDFHGRSLILSHGSEATPVTPIIPLERRTISVNGGYRLDPREKRAIVVASCHEKETKLMKNDFSFSPVNRLLNSNLNDLSCKYSTDEVTCNSNETFHIKRGEDLIHNINQPLDLSKRKRLHSVDTKDNVNAKSGESTLANVKVAIKSLGSTFLVDNQNNCLYSTCKTSANVMDCVTMDTRSHSKENNTNTQSENSFTSPGKSDTMTNNFHKNISIAFDDELTCSKNQSNIFETCQLLSPRATMKCTSIATMTTVNSCGGQSKLPASADRKCLMLADGMKAVDVTQESESKKGKGDTLLHDLFTSHSQDGHGDSDMDQCSVYQCPGVPVWVETSVTKLTQSRDCPSHESPSLAVSSLPAKCIQSSASTLPSSSPPPSPLRLVLPTYAQSHNLPYPAYCILGNSVSPAVSSLSNAPTRQFDPRLTSEAYRNSAACVSQSPTCCKSPSRMPVDPRTVSCTKESTSIPSPSKNDSPSRKRRRDHTCSSHPSSPHRHSGQSKISTKCTGDKVSSSPKDKKYRHHSASHGNDTSTSSISQSKSIATASCSRTASKVSIDDVTVTNSAQKCVSTILNVLNDCANVTSNGSSLAALCTPANDECTLSRKRKSEYISRHPPSPPVVPCTKKNINSSINVQNTITTPPGCLVESTRSYSHPLSPPPSPAIVPPRVGSESILPSSQLTDSIVGQTQPLSPPPQSQPPSALSPTSHAPFNCSSSSSSSVKCKSDGRSRGHSSRSHSHSHSERSSGHSSRRHSSSNGRHFPRRSSPNYFSRRSEHSSHGNSSPLRSPDIDNRVNRTLHIGRLCLTVHKEELRSLFASLGGDVLNVYIKPPLPTGRPTFAFVKFANLIDAYHAKNKFHLTKLGNTRILTGYGRINATNRLWLGNLDKSIDSATLYKELDRFGSIVKLAYYKDKGEAVVQFETIAGAESARDSLRGESFSDRSKHKRSHSNKSSPRCHSSSTNTCNCSTSLHASDSIDSSNCKDCQSKKSRNTGNCQEEIIIMTNESGSLETFIMSPMQVQKKYPNLWHRSKSTDKVNCTSNAAIRTSSPDKIPEDEDFTKVKKGIIVTDFIDDPPRHMIEFEASNDS